MFFPKAMAEIELIVPSKDLMAVTRILSGYGVFHQTDSNYPGVASGSASTWQEKAGAYAALERRIQIVMQSLFIDEEPHPSSEVDAVVEVESVRPTVEKIEDEVKKVSDQLISERKRLEQLESTLHQLEPVEDIDLDISSLRNSRYLFSMLGQIPNANIDRLQTSLARVPFVFLILRSDSAKPVVWLAGTKANADVLARAARSAYLNPLSLPDDYQGTPAKIIEALRSSIDSSKRAMAELKETLNGFAAQYKQQLHDLLWQTHTARVLADAIVRFGQLRHTYVVTGWVTADDMDGFTQRLRNASKEILIETLPSVRHGENQHIPVALTNNKFLRPFQMLVNTYARPRYGEVDPTILIALTFPLLFGAMFGDIGQGLVLALLGWLLANKKIKALSSMSSLGGIIMSVGASATVFGFLYGSIFGFEGHHVEEYLGFTLHPLWLSPIEQILPILSFAIDVGIVLLIVGFLLGIFNHLRSKDWAHLIFGHNGVVGLAFYILFLGLLGSFLSQSPIAPKLAVAISSLPIPFSILAGVFAVAIMFSSLLRNLVEGHRPLIEGGIATFIIQSVMELFETLVSFLSNTLSYVRVGAFAVAHGGLSMAFFSIAGDEPDLGFWITLLIGNIFFVVVEALIVGIQTMRLSYYEFFGKFFTGGGMRFEPLTLTPATEEG